MLDKRHIFRRMNFIFFISYSLISILNDLSITTIPLPIDLSVCIVLFLCFNSIFEQNNHNCKTKDRSWKYNLCLKENWTPNLRKSWKIHPILIVGVDFFVTRFAIFLYQIFVQSADINKQLKLSIQTKVKYKPDHIGYKKEKNGIQCYKENFPVYSCFSMFQPNKQ